MMDFRPLDNKCRSEQVAERIMKMIESGELSTKELDEKVRRVLRLNFRTAMNTRKPFGSMNTEEHLNTARTIAGEGIVLLKNDGDVLPFDITKCKKNTLLIKLMKC